MLLPSALPYDQQFQLQAQSQSSPFFFRPHTQLSSPSAIPIKHHTSPLPSPIHTTCFALQALLSRPTLASQRPSRPRLHLRKPRRPEHAAHSVPSPPFLQSPITILPPTTPKQSNAKIPAPLSPPKREPSRKRSRTLFETDHNPLSPPSTPKRQQQLIPPNLPLGLSPSDFIEPFAMEQQPQPSRDPERDRFFRQHRDLSEMRRGLDLGLGLGSGRGLGLGSGWKEEEEDDDDEYRHKTPKRESIQQPTLENEMTSPGFLSLLLNLEDLGLKGRWSVGRRLTGTGRGKGKGEWQCRE